MNVGLLFTELEASKASLSIEDYSVAQPTLEQVFIRTVEKYSEGTSSNKQQNTVSSDLHTVKLVSTDQLERMAQSNKNDNNDVSESNINEEVFVAAVNSCGCTPLFAKRFAWFVSLLCLLFIVIGIFAQSSVLITIGSAFILISVIACCVCCLPCCQPVVDADE